jgi:hypothetical protein
MEAFGHLELTVQEQPDELLFRIDREYGWAGRVALPAACVAMLMISLFLTDTGMRISLAGVALFMLAVWGGVTLFRPASDRSPIQTTILSVTSQRLEASGVLDRGTAFGRRSKIVVPASEVRKIAYGMGSEDAEGGLYVAVSFWKSECMLPGLNREQCKLVAERIARRFPEIGRER